MRVTLFLALLFSFGISRSPSLQRCLSALADFDGFDGNSAIVVKFPKEYPEDELRKTIEDLGSLVIEASLYSDMVAIQKKNEEDSKRNYDIQVKKYHQYSDECDELKKAHNAENAKLWFWNKKLPNIQDVAPMDASEDEQTSWNACQRARHVSFYLNVLQRRGPPGWCDESTIKIKAL